MRAVNVRLWGAKTRPLAVTCAPFRGTEQPSAGSFLVGIYGRDREPGRKPATTARRPLCPVSAMRDRGKQPDSSWLPVRRAPGRAPSQPIDPTVGEVIRNNSRTVDRDMVAYQATMSSAGPCRGRADGLGVCEVYRWRRGGGRGTQRHERDRQ
jgi:hypothetical protein